MKASSGFSKALVVLALAGGLIAFAPGSAAAAAVDVAFATNGTPAFGATVTVKATITINDGSTLQSMHWMQAGGPTAVLAGTTTDTVSVTLADRAGFRTNLIHKLSEPGITPDQFPDNVPEPDFPVGLQDRWVVTAINPLSLEHAAQTVLEFEVVTSSGTYDFETEVATPLPWPVATGNRDVPVTVPVVLHGRTQASYNWALTVPPGSAAHLIDGTTQNPEFTPDIPGTYQVSVADLDAGNTVGFSIYAGLWRGVIVGQDANGRPVPDTACTGCHAPNTPLDMFTPWKASGHAEIFTDNLNTSTHYSESCLSCHTVGYDPNYSNNGFDDQPDFEAFIESGMLHHADTSNWTNMLAQFPKTAKLANIQCENCHGPQNSEAHTQGSARETLSSDLCGSCHGEPARHGRFQQWQLSGHANYDTANAEGNNGGCAMCHSANGFIAWEESGFTATSVQVTWGPEDTHPQTCAACHDPHAVGTTSGSPASNATVRVSGDTPMLMAGFAAHDVGRGAICMTCHNGRRGLRNDSNYNPADASRAPHVGPQADVIMGQNFYLVPVGTPSYHSRVAETCVTCHMDKTPPPPDLSYQLGGTNHTFYASKEICSKCHATITAADVQAPVMAKMEELKADIEAALIKVMGEQIAVGAKIDFGGTTITSITQIKSVDYEESHGRQGLGATLADDTVIAPVALNSIKVVPVVGSAVEILRVADSSLAKAGWNYNMVNSDASMGVHNPTMINQALDVSIYAVKNLPSSTGGTADSGIGGGPGNGAGAVSCTTPYVYWAEIAAHAGGEGTSMWRTDLAARNLASDTAALRFVLHTNAGDHEATSTIPGAGQGIFEDIVGMMGLETKGALEICSDKPLLVVGRIFNQSDNGTYGQFLDGHVADLGLNAGEFASLLGLRQETGKFRTNISVTNGGTDTAEVDIALYDNAGNELTTYSLSVPAGQVIQDLKPFEVRANAPDLGWGFAVVKVMSGSNVRTSASVIDAVTNDATTIPAKR